MSCTLIFTAGAKGGSGKTTAARFLITYLQEKESSPLILDLDDENHTLSRFFPEALQIGIQPEFAHDVLIEKAISQEHGTIVADLKAGTGHEVLKWFLELPFPELKRRGVEFVCVGSITSAPDSVQSFLNWAASLDDHVRYLVFRNLKDGEQLFDYDQTRQAGEFRTRFNPAHVTVPKLSPLYQTELEIRRLTISQVLAWSDGASGNGDSIGPILSPLLARARLRTFQNNIYAQLDQAAELLLPQSQKASPEAERSAHA
jgi:CobQ/CobB/MinD/ParA family nucleotide binding protein